MSTRMPVGSPRDGGPSHAARPGCHSVDRLAAGSGFVVAAGIESASPLVGDGLRRDLLRETRHHDRYDADYALLADMGIRYVRIGLPFHEIAADPHRLDWSWTDRALASMARHGLEPIAELMHGGVPDDLSGVCDPRLPERFLQYAEAFGARYPRVRCVTPVSEPWLTADLSAATADWNDRRADDRSLVIAVEHLARCSVLAMQALRAARSDVVFVETDACTRWTPTGPGTEEDAAFHNERRFVIADMAHGRLPARPMIQWLLRNRMPESRLEWFTHHGSIAGCVTGHVYTASSERLVVRPGEWRRCDPADGYASVARDYHDRLGLPFLLAGTSHESAGATDWLASTWDDALALRDEGLPIRGFCWYGLTDGVDWDAHLGERDGRSSRSGLVDLERRSRPVGELYARLAGNARAGIFERIGSRAGSAAAR